MTSSPASENGAVDHGGRGSQPPNPAVVSLLAGLLVVGAALLLARGEAGVPWGVGLLVLAALVLWSDPRIPRGISGLILLAGVEVLRIPGVDTAFHGFSQPAFLFFFAILSITTAIERTGTAGRLAHGMLRHGRLFHPRALAWRAPAAMVGSALFIASASGRTGLLVPLTDRLLGGRSTHRGLRTYLTVFLAHLSPLTSRVFLSGGAGVIVSAELLSRAGYSFTWWGWFAWFGIPTVAAVILTSLGHWMWLRPQALAEPEVEQSGLEPQDRHLLTAVGAMVLLWLVGPRFGVTTTAGALAGMGLVAWVTRAPRDWLRDLDWDLILFVGATLSLAHIIEGSGLATWAGASATTWARHLEGSRLLLPGLLSFFVLLRLPLHNGIGYSAIVIPVALAMGSLGSIDVLGVAFVSILASSITFLPVQSTPAMLSHVRQPAPAGAYAVSGLLTFVSVLLVVQFLLDPWWGFLSHGP